MQLETVFDSSFKPYGKIAEGIQTEALVEKMRETIPKPSPGTIYVPSDSGLEALPCFEELSTRFYGGMPIQIGYCSGTNTKLNCLEYHRDSEVNIPDGDIILLVARMEEITDGFLDTSKVKAFLVPSGTAVELYATTLHYAPCDAKTGGGFRVAVVLPRGTNTEKPLFSSKCREDTLLAARNKWLLAHPDSPEAANGMAVGLKGENIDIAACIQS